MKNWTKRNFFPFSLVLAFLLYWIFGDIIVFITIFAVVAFFFGMKGIYKITYFYIEIIIFILYLIFALICLLFLSIAGIEVLVIILGIWFISSFLRVR